MEGGSHWKLLSPGVARPELLCPESRSFWPLAAVFIFHSLGSPRFFLVWLFIYLSCLLPCYPPLLLPAHSLSPTSSGLILIMAVPAGEDGFPWLVPTWCPKKIPPEQLLSALFWALVDTAISSLEQDINRSQPLDVTCLLISAPRSPLMTGKSKQ